MPVPTHGGNDGCKKDRYKNGAKWPCANSQKRVLRSQEAVGKLHTRVSLLDSMLTMLGS